jgi:hypothetical protein
MESEEPMSDADVAWAMLSDAGDVDPSRFDSMACAFGEV